MEIITGKVKEEVIEKAKKNFRWDFYVIKNGKEYQAKEIVAYIDEEIIGSEVFLKKTRGWKVADPAFVAAVVMEERDIVRHSFKADRLSFKSKKEALKYEKEKQLDKRRIDLMKALEEERNK